NRHNSVDAKLHAGSITDISLNGVCILIPRDVHSEMSVDQDKSNFEIIFTLPNEKRPIHLMCESQRIADSKEFIHVGASFVDADFHSYKALQTYLM
ncbi:MAG TPA: PilZ domain-containing protein, partial [Syntrophales bacterium]|nr:PilZ domain-containing protein [Syntrophales bacterium]